MNYQQFFKLFYYIDDYKDFHLTWISITSIIIIILLIIAKVSLIWSENSEKKELEQSNDLKKLGYTDKDDIDVFLKSTNYDIEDFLVSKGLRKQYDLFTEGKESKFMEDSKKHKEVNDAQSSGMTTGLVVGMAINQSTHH